MKAILSIFSHKYIVFLMVLIFGLIGFVVVKNNLSPKVNCNGYTLNIILVEPLQNNSSGKLPKEFSALFKIIKECSDSVAFYPLSNSGFTYVGMNDTINNSINISVLKHQPDDIVRKNEIDGDMSDEIESYLNNKNIPESFFTVSKNSSMDNFNKISEYVAKNRISGIIVCIDDNSINEYNLNGKNYPVCHSIKEFKAKRDSLLCKNVSSKVLLLYHPPITTMSHETFETYKGKIDSIDNTKGLDTLFKNVSNNFDKNLSFYVDYLYAIKNIKGLRHILAFKHLMSAASIAIAKDEELDMLGIMEGDENTALWKLSHGHKDIWDAINKALWKKDATILDSIDLEQEALEHHESLVEHD